MKIMVILAGLISTFFTLVGYYGAYVYECSYSVDCYNFVFHFAHPVMYGSGALAIVFALLYAFPHAFSAWKKFAVWFVPLAVLLFIFYPNPGSGDFLAPMPEQIFQWVSALYVIASSIVIGVASRK